jgi:transcriptional regulator with XRE-family HTH domain
MKLEELGTFIRAQRRSASLSLRKLSHLAGISNPYLSQIERGLRKPSAEILQAIAKALGISSETLYVRAGILEDNRALDPITEILKDDKLTEKQKHNLIDTYRNYVELNRLGSTEASTREPHEPVASVPRTRLKKASSRRIATSGERPPG